MDTPEEARDTSGRRYRADGSEVRAQDYLRPDFRLLQGLLPVLVFIVLNRQATTQIAIGASFLVSIVVFWHNRSSGIIRFLTVLGFSLVAVAAVIGLILDNDKIFVAQNIATDFAIVAVSIGSIMVGKPLIGALARELTPGIRSVMAIDHPVFVKLTLINAALNVVTGVARIFLLQEVTANQYAVLSRVLFFPLSFAFVLLCFIWIGRTAIRIWPADVPFEDIRPGGREPKPAAE